MNPTPAAATSVSRIASHMFMPTSVAMTPMNSPAVPVITPAERSNSPPIIRSATATAGIPIVDATSVQLAAPSSVPKSSVVTAKKSPITAAAMSAPSSGRRSSLVSILTSAMRSSTTDVGGGGSSAVAWLLIPVSSSSLARVPGGPEPAGSGPPDVGSARALLRELLDGIGVGLVHEAGAGEHRQPAADRVGVLVEQRQEHDRQISLEVLLLVDGELDLGGLDRLHDVAAEVERRHLRLRPRAPDRVARGDGDVRVERQHGADRVVRLELGLDLGERRGDVRDALHLQVLDLAAEALPGPVAALLEADVALLVDDAEQLAGVAALGQPPTGGLAGHRLVLADVRDRAELRGVGLARVQRDHRNARVHCLLERVPDGVGVGRGGRDAVYLLGHRGIDQLRLALRVVLRLAVLDLDAHVLAGLLRAGLGDRPEGVALSVGDHGDREITSLAEGDVLAPAAALVVVVIAARRHERRQPQYEQGGQQDEPSARTRPIRVPAFLHNSLHRSEIPPPFAGARLARYSMLT